MPDEPRRAGPLAQFLWDLATLPSLQEQYGANPKAVLAARGLDNDDVHEALSGNKEKLGDLLRTEDTKLDATFGPRRLDTTIGLEGWPSGPPSPTTE